MIPSRLQSHRTWILSLTDQQVPQCQVLHSLLTALGLDHSHRTQPGQIAGDISLTLLSVPEH